MRLLPRTLGGQLTALLLLALALSQVVVYLTYSSERGQAIRQADRVGLIENTASVLRVLRLAPAETRARLAAAASSPRVRIWTSVDSVIGNPGPRSQFTRFIGPLPDSARIQIIRDDNAVDIALPDPNRNRLIPFAANDRYDILVSVPFPDGGWLNAQTQTMGQPVTGAWASAPATAVMAILILLIVAVTVRRVTKPLRGLAVRADALGKGTPQPPVPEEGPDEVRRVTTAFNRMQERLHRFVTDRTRMIAAIGHDLRTPITSLKLRAELLDDDETKTKMLATLDEMQRMVEATLAFASEEATIEPARSVDLSALIETIVDDQADVGKNVTFTESPRLPYNCRPIALKRALNNLIQNALQYGDRARVALRDEATGPVISIEDDGPGIPPERLDDVFQPFVRIEGSRSRETGGVGLGLSIARSIVLAHGGELLLSNRPGGGLRAEIRLPPGEGTGRASPR